MNKEITKKNPKKKRGCIYFLGTAILLLICISSSIGVFIMSQLFIQNRRETYVNEVDEKYEDLSINVDKLIKELLSEIPSSRAALPDHEIMYDRAKDIEKLVIEIYEDIDSVKDRVKDINDPVLEEYYELVEDYTEKTDSLIQLAQDDMLLSYKYTVYFKGYEDLNKRVIRSKSYIYADTDKFLNGISKGVKEMEHFVEEMRIIKLEEENYKDYHDSHIEFFNKYLDYLKTLESAAENRDNSELEVERAENNRYSIVFFENYSSLSEEIKDEIREIDDELSTLNQDLEETREDIKSL